MRPFDIQSFIDEQRIRPIHYSVLGLCMVAMFIDGFDIFMVGKIAPAIAHAFGVPPAGMTLVFLLQQIGLALGAFLISPLADLLGRKRMLIVLLLHFGLLSIFMVFSTSIVMLAILRGLSGIFLAGIIPIAVALLSEFTPGYRRATFVAIGMAGYSLGHAAGAAMAFLVRDFGWESAFWIGGIMPLLLAPVLMFKLPESLSFRALRNPADPAIARTIRRIAPGIMLTGEERFVTLHDGRPIAKSSPLDLFRDGRAGASAIIFAACTLSMGTIALLAAWLPSFFQQMAGISIQRFAIAAIIGLLGGMAGMLTIGFLMDLIRPVRLLPVYFACYGCALTMLGRIDFETRLFIPALSAVAFFQGGGQAGLNMLMAQIYPTAIRSTGMGWAGGAGRIGGIILPLFGGYALHASLSLQVTLALVALAPFTVAMLLLLMPEVGAARNRSA